jgi:hypothetical protein
LVDEELRASSDFADMDFSTRDRISIVAVGVEASIATTDLFARRELTWQSKL